VSGRFYLPGRVEALRQALLPASREAGAKCYFVGGLVRDLLLGREPEEADVAVEGDPREVGRLLSQRLSLPLVSLDPEAGVYRIPHPFGLRYLDLSLAEGGSIVKDLLRRDFTVNGIARPAEAGPNFGEADLIDPTGGLRDLKGRLIRMVSEGNLRADPVRLLRGWRLRWLLGFEIEPKTREAMSRLSPLLKGEAGERVRDEFFRVLEMGCASEALFEASSLGLLFSVIPELEPLKEIPPNGYHHLDGLSHSIEAVGKVEEVLRGGLLGPATSKFREELSSPSGHGFSRLSRLKFCALLHDVGKPKTAERDEEGWLHFRGHERVGARMAREIAERLKFTAKDAEAVERVVKAHMRPCQLAMEPQVTERAKVRLFRDLGDLTVEVLVLSYADRLAAMGEELEPEVVRRQTDFLRELCEKFLAWREERGRGRLLTGHDVMRRYGLKPGPLVGEILRRVEEEGFARGIRTREEALKVADEVARSLGVIGEDGGREG